MIIVNNDSNHSNINWNVQFIFLCNPPKSSVNICFKKILKSTANKKVIVYFYNLFEENLLKIATFVSISNLYNGFVWNSQKV